MSNRPDSSINAYLVALGKSLVNLLVLCARQQLFGAGQKLGSAAPIAVVRGLPNGEERGFFAVFVLGE